MYLIYPVAESLQVDYYIQYRSSYSKLRPESLQLRISSTVRPCGVLSRPAQHTIERHEVYRYPC